MKLFLVFVSTAFAFATQADCLSKAVQTAKENARVHMLQSVQTLPTKPYMEAYRINLVSGFKPGSDTESITVALMKSDCTVVSVIPKLGP